MRRLHWSQYVPLVVFVVLMIARVPLMTAVPVTMVVGVVAYVLGMAWARFKHRIL